jgi:predicted nucleotidyltransferase
MPAIHQIILFGSRARGDADDRSDIDIAIEAPDLSKQDWHIFLGIIDELPTLLSLDIIRLEEAPGELKANIYKEGKILYERN